MGIKMVVKTQIPGLRRVAVKLGVDEQGDVQKYVTNEVMKRLPAYMPKKTGELESKMRMSKPTQIHVEGPYARVQFFGVTKHGVPFAYDTSANPKAGSHWDRRMVADEGNAIRAKVQRRVNMLGRG